MAKTIADIKPIAEGSSDHFYKKSALGKYVEEPVLKACEILWEKNIKTVMSSANRNDIGRFAYIDIDYRFLSEKNKRIVKKKRYKFSKMHSSVPFLCAEISLKIQDSKIDIDYIKRYFVDRANEFEHQELKWGFVKADKFIKEKIDEGYLDVKEAYSWFKQGNENNEKITVDMKNIDWKKLQDYCNGFHLIADKKTELIFYSREMQKKYHESHSFLGKLLS